MSSLPTLGTIAYGPTPGNWFTFPVETETTGVSIVPVLDSAQRTTIGNRYSFKIKSLIAGSSDTGNTLADIRNRLTRPCQIFQYSGHGLGTISVNGAGGQQDLAWGPIPKMLSWKPVGGNLASEIEWEVEFMVLDCKTSPPWFQIMEFCYELSYSQDANRLTRRTYRGHIRIPNNRTSVGGRNLIDSPDRYYEKVVPVLGYGFRRESEERSLSEDKAKLSFTIVDQQMEYPPPPGVLEWTFDHTQQNAEPIGPRWSIAFHGRYKMAMHYPPALGYTYFIKSVLDRLNAIRQAAAGTVLLPVHLSFREDVKNLTGDFSAIFSAVIRIDQAVQAGMWRPLPGDVHEFRRWRQSMALANVPRGFTQELFQPNDDVIIDLCGTGTADLAPPNRPANPATTLSGGFPCPPCPDPSTSWLWWQCAVSVSYDQGTADHMPLPSKPLPKPQPTLTDLLPLSTAGSAAARDPQAQAIQQQRTAPRVYVTLRGYAVRVCYGINPPKIQSVAGLPVLPANRKDVEYFSSVVMPGVCQPIVLARWEQRWLVSPGAGGGSGGGSLSLPGGSGTPPRPKPGPFSGGFIIIAPGQGTDYGGPWF